MKEESNQLRQFHQSVVFQTLVKDFAVSCLYAREDTDDSVTNVKHGTTL